MYDYTVYIFIIILTMKQLSLNFLSFQINVIFSKSNTKFLFKNSAQIENI